MTTNHGYSRDVESCAHRQIETLLDDTGDAYEVCQDCGEVVTTEEAVPAGL